MISNDLINGAFEMGGAILNATTSVRALIRDKEIKGFSPLPLVFWTLWGFWNIFYYPSLDQMFSFFGGLAVVSVNCVYLALILRYSLKPLEDTSL